MCHYKAVFLIVVSAEIAQAHHFPIQVSLGINWPLYQTTCNSPNMFNKGNILEVFPNIFSLLSNLTSFPSAFSLFKAKVGEYKENNNEDNTEKILPWQKGQRRPFSLSRREGERHRERMRVRDSKRACQSMSLVSGPFTHLR